MYAYLRKLATVVIMVVAFFVVGFVPASAQNCFVHTIVDGETLVDIAKDYGVKAADVIELNGLTTNVLTGVTHLIIYPCDQTTIVTNETDDTSDTDESAAAAPVTSAPQTTTSFTQSSPDELQFEIVGAPEHVDMNNVDYARGGFSSPWPFQSHVLAEPGKLQVGPDHDQALIDGSRGAVRRTDPGNQFRVMNNDLTNVGCQEGSLLWISIQGATMDFGGRFTVTVRAPDGSNLRVYVKCPNVDSLVGSDAGGNIALTEYTAGYGLVQQFSANPPGGFISSDGEMQALGISQGTDSCGGEGCISTYVLGIDMNTGAYTLSVWDGANMLLIETNWWVLGTTPAVTPTPAAAG